MVRREVLALVTGAVLLAALLYPDAGGIGEAIQPRITHAEGGTPAVIINELAWAGSSASSSDEWIELKNTTAEDIDLAGWQLTKYTSGKQQQLMIDIIPNPEQPLATVVPAGGYFLIAHNEPDHDFGDGKSSRLNVEPNLVKSAVTLADNNLWIRLYSGIWNGGGELVDEAGDGGKALAGSSSAKTSMERNDVYGLGNLSESWHEATEAINLDADIIDKATPKAANSVPAKLPPSVVLINPTSAEIDTILEMETIEGSDFITTGTTQVKIQSDGQSIFATEAHVATPFLIDSARFDLHGATAGQWDIVVINPDGQEGMLPNALELIEPEEPEEELDYSQDVIINEIYPKPKTGSNDEFIELYNTGEVSVNLKNWRLDDQSPGGSAEYTIEDDYIITPHGYTVFTKTATHISLNDTGDSTRLIQPDGKVVSQLAYGTAQSGYSYSWIENQWQWTMRVTKGSKNILELPEEDENDQETIGGEQDNGVENPQGIEIELSVRTVTATTAMLEWQLDELGFVDEVEVYVSQKAEEQGGLAQVAPARNLEAEIVGLSPGTQYFFAITGDYNAYTAISNQVTATTKTKAAGIIGGIGILKQIIITELLPNPGGGDSEFIEIYNPTDQPIVISGWKLMDKSKRRYVFTALDLAPIQVEDEEENDELVIEPGQYLMLEQDITGIHLNNSGGEELYLLNGEDGIIDTVNYVSTARRDYAYALAPNGKWFWTEEATPGAANDIVFAGETEDAQDYLTPSGLSRFWAIAGWLSLLLSAIMLVGIKRDEKIYHQK